MDFIALWKQIFDEINKVWTNPKSIIKQLEKSLSSFESSKILTLGKNKIITHEGIAAYMETIEILETMRPQKAFWYSNELEKSAEDHAADCENQDSLKPVGSDGSFPNERI